MRWAGSKKKLVPQLTRYVPPHFKRYIEPFAGSAVLFTSGDTQNRPLMDT
jgi:DNA adenine methylase